MYEFNRIKKKYEFTDIISTLNKITYYINFLNSKIEQINLINKNFYKKVNSNYIEQIKYFKKDLIIDYTKQIIKNFII